MENTTSQETTQNRSSGQALIEYALILVLVGIAFGFALAAAGPVVGNVFSNTVYNLLGQTPIGEGRDIARPGDFWLTVTWVAENPLVEQPLPTRTSAPPSQTPTPGSPPPPTPVTPSSTPRPTNTPQPTPTPEDFAFEAPHLDTVDTPEHWRLGSEVGFGSNPWVGTYFSFPSSLHPRSGGAMNTPAFTIDNNDLGLPPSLLDFTSSGWPTDPGGLPWPAANPGNYFAARFTRKLYIPETTIVSFTANADDGVRMWLYPESGPDPSSCSATGVKSGDGSSTSNQFYGDGHPSYATDCLLMDDWTDGGNNGGTVTRTVTGLPGEHYILQVDMYERSGGHKISTKMRSGGNPDDLGVCNWQELDRADDANSLDFMWDEYGGGDFPTNSTCYLEFRGYVTVPDLSSPTPIINPEFVFWDIWDFEQGGGRLNAWLEVAEYIPDAAVAGKADRDAMTWHRIDLHQGAAQNYNWTRHSIDLTDVLGDGTVNMSGKRVTFRFGMSNTDSNGRRRWYIDDVEFRDNNDNGARREFVDYIPGTKLTLNEANAAKDFITSGHWELTSHTSLPDFDNPDNPEGCCSWELRPNERFADFSEDGGNLSTGGVDKYDITRTRVHAVEFNGYVDINPAFADDEGDTGDALLQFYHAFYVGDETGLEVQYTTDPFGTSPANWQPIPGSDPGNPVGRIRDIEFNSDSGGDQRSLELIEIPLAELENNGITRFRLRFALLAIPGSDKRGAPSGWWIDEIYLHREGPPRFVDYPFIDSAEIGMDNWQISGQWWRTNTSFRTPEENGHSFTDSPAGDYNSNADTSLTFVYPLDLLNDSPDNLALTDRNPAGGNSGGAAIDPKLTFWHWRSLDRNDNFYVEWRNINDPDDDWKILWAYIYRMNSNPSDTSDWAAVQTAWEYVEVELSPIIRTFSGDASITDDDDIYIRFRLDADNNRERDGVYIDDIRLEERVEQVFRLWPTSERRDVDGDGTNDEFGNGARFGADFDESNWFEKWRMGGDWEAIEWEQHNGLRGAHNSVRGQEFATGRRYERNDDRDWDDRNDTYSILEMSQIIDLRATRVEEKPTLYFWTRYHIGNDDYISVQISEEIVGTEGDLDIDIGSRCGSSAFPQCYDQLRGWSPWITSNDYRNWPWAQNEWDYDHTWTRKQIDLSQYASPNASTPGSRIRIRFVNESLNNNNNRDGWYVDNVSIIPREDNVIRGISEGAFFDPARNLNNWVAEGHWGLSPEIFRGSGGGPATLGTWQESFWDCRDCESLVGGSGSTRFRRGADEFLDSDGAALPAYQTPVTRTVLDINYDIRRDAPRPGVFDARDRFVGRWTLDTPVVGPTSGVNSGDYTFITISDDGVRMKAEEIDGSGNPVNPTPPTDALEWNIIYNWTDHGRTADMGTVTFEEGKRYRVTLEWYEKWSDAVLIATTGGSSFSFTDSPKQIPSPNQSDDAQAQPNSNSSLVLKGTLDLAGTTNPIIEYYTLYETWGTLRVEVSTDGGFTWTEDGLRDSYVEQSSGATINVDDPSWGGDWHRPARDWRRRRHNLTDYVGEQIMLRFRYDNLGRNNWNEDRYKANIYYNGWWIVDIRVGE